MFIHEWNWTMLKVKNTSLLKNIAFVGDSSSCCSFFPFITFRTFTCNEIFKKEFKCLLFWAYPFFQTHLCRVYQVLSRVLMSAAQNLRYTFVFQKVSAYWKRLTYKWALPCRITTQLKWNKVVDPRLFQISHLLCFLI